MSTLSTFSALLNQYVTFDLLYNEFVKRDFLFNKLEKDTKWKGGPIPVPFVAGQPSSVAFGSLVPEDDVAEMVATKGLITVQPELWGTLLFNQKDLWVNDKVSEQNFLRILPDQIDGMMEYLKSVVSTNLLSGRQFATLVADGTAGGVITVDHPERFVISQAVYVASLTQPALKGYVSNVDFNAKTVTLVTTRGGAVAVNYSAYTVADRAKVYNQGALTDGFTSLRDVLLAPAHGGAALLYGVNKTAYPYLQALNIDGSDITATNILQKLFDFVMQTRMFSAGSARGLTMSYKHFGTILKLLESQKGPYNVIPGSQKTSVYGWDTIMIGGGLGGAGGMEVTAVREMDDDVIYALDFKSMKFISNGLFKFRTNPDSGSKFYEIRTTQGFKYLVDIALMGDLVISKPQANAVLYGINY